MTPSLKLLVLIENSVRTGGLRAEHGLAWVVERGGRRVLFDTGQTDLLRENAAALGCPLGGLDVIALSHGHYDHTGGLASVCRCSPGARVFLHPEAVHPKFTANVDGTPRYIGMSETSRRAVDDEAWRVVRTAEAREVVPGVFLTGTIPRETGFEAAGTRLFLDAGLREPDSVPDDQALFVPTPQGTVVMLGCAHAGIINTLHHIRRLTGEPRFRAILGGLHLLDASDERLDATVRALAAMDIPLLVPGHCTGLRATARLWECFPGRCAGLGVGSRFTFE